jgi:RNA polymerase sigma-32 factor
MGDKHMNIAVEGNMSRAKINTTELRKDALNAFLADRGNVEVRNDLIRTHMWIVESHARKFSRRGLTSYDDLRQEGVFGLVEAAEKFNPAFANNFATYATYWVRQKIRRFANETRGFACNKSASRVERDSMAARRAGVDAASATFSISLDAADDLGITLATDDPTQEEFAIGGQSARQIRQSVEVALSQSKDPRDRIIVKERLMAESPITLAELGIKMGVTKQRAEQKEKALLQKIKEQLVKHRK